MLIIEKSKEGAVLDTYFTFVFFIFGTVFGSFYNVVGIRLPKNTLLEKQRSHCPTCDRTLHWYELIPVLSYVLQRGKCRGCNEKISPMYPLIELGTGIVFALCYQHFGLETEVIFALAFVSCCIIIIVSDLRYSLIPNAVLVLFLPVFIGWRILYPYRPWITHSIGLVVAFILLFLIIFLSKGGMGIGDLKFFSLLGWVFGLELFFLLFLLAMGYGTLISIGLMAMGKVSRKSKIPFGPFISLAAITVLFYGYPIIEWYLNLF